MRRLATFLLLSGCATELPLCQPDDDALGAGADGPDGFSADDLVAFTEGARTFDARDVAEDGLPAGVLGGVRVTVGGRAGRAAVRTWAPGECGPAVLAVPVEVELVSDDGSLAVAGEVDLLATSLDAAGVYFDTASERPLDGVVPAALREAAAAEQTAHCAEDADEAPTVRVFLSGGFDAPTLAFDAQYARRGVCNYAASLAFAELAPVEE